MTYGIIYGIGAKGLAATLLDQGVDVQSAGRLIKDFLAHFSGVNRYISR